MSVLEKIYAKAKLNPQKVAFPEAHNEKIMQAAYECTKEGYIQSILVGDAEQLKALAAERGYEESAFTFVDINEETYKNELIAKYGLKADKSSVDGLILYVSELLGGNYSFDPIIKEMEHGIEDNIRNYFVSMLYNQVTGLSAGSVVPALNFVPTRVNDKGRIVPNTANINNVMKLIDDLLSS